MVALITFVAAALLALAQADSGGVKVHVMSFNVRTSQASGDATSTCSNWGGVRKDNVVKQITNVMPDFVGTQETSDEQKGYLDAQLTGKYVAVGVRTGSLDGRASEIDALYYKTSDWAVISSGTFWYGPNTEIASAAWKMEYYRTAVWGRFTHIASGQTACVFNTHYETPGNDEAQLQASAILLTKLDTLCQAGDKIKVVTGDFNALPNYPAILKLLANGLTESSSEFTFCGDMMSSTCQTKFDYTLHRLSDGACHVKSDVLRTSFNGCYPSDHAVLMGTFCFGGTCCNGDSSSSSSGSLNSSSTTNGTGSATGTIAGENLVQGTVRAADGSKASAGSTAGGATTVITTKSEESSSATGTVFAIIGVIAATAGIAFFVVRKKKQLDARIDASKSAAVPMPSYFGRSAADSDALSPLPAAALMSAPSPGRMSNSPGNRMSSVSGRMSNSPVPTLMATKRDSRDSRSSSVSCKDLSPTAHQRGRNTSNASSTFRMSSPVVMMDTTSNYSESFDSRRLDSRINFSEAYITESYDSDEDSGALSKKSSTDFAML